MTYLYPLDFIEDDESNPRCALPDIRFVAYSAGAVVVVLALLGVSAAWILSRLRPW